jgi:hypothetical protein
MRNNFCAASVMLQAQQLVTWLMPGDILDLYAMSAYLCRSVPQAGDPAESTGEGSKKKWFEEKKKRQEEQLAKLGLTPEEAHRLESAEVAEAKYKKKVGVAVALAVARLWRLSPLFYRSLLSSKPTAAVAFCSQSLAYFVPMKATIKLGTSASAVPSGAFVQRVLGCGGRGWGAS